MIYVLEGHDLKHAVEEMLLHMRPAELPVCQEHVPESGDYCVSRLVIRDDVAQAQAEAFWGGERHVGQSKASIEGLDALAQNRVTTELVKLALYDAIVAVCPRRRRGAA